MSKRFDLALGVATAVFLGAGAAGAAPSYCPTTSPAVCPGRQVGDIVVGLHYTGRLLGIRPGTGAVYTFSSALEPNSNVELGDLAVVPSDPRHIVAVGNVDSDSIGIKRLDSCGSITSTVYGPFPDPLGPPPLPPVGGLNVRGLAFNPVSGRLYSPFGTLRHIGGTEDFTALLTFPHNGGALTVQPAWEPDWADSIQSFQKGIVAADELGTLYFGAGNRMVRVSTVVGGDGPITEYSISGNPPEDIWDIIHDGNHHLYVTGKTSGQGKVWRFDTLSGFSQLWTSDRGPSFGNEPFNELHGITLDAQGHLLVVEGYSDSNGRAGVVKISKNDGGVMQYFALPTGTAEVVTMQNQPWSLAVLGTNLPTVREACSSDCQQDYVSDCFGACMPAAWLGDNFCDEGPESNMTCWARGFDLGDCEFCPEGQVPDCNGHCAPAGWVGDFVCDDGGYTFEGNPISFDCEEFRFDEATCRGCGWGEMLDCNGECSPQTWYADNVCDDGGWSHLGHPVVYRCVEYDFDGNDCQVGG